MIKTKIFIVSVIVSSFNAAEAAAEAEELNTQALYAKYQNTYCLQPQKRPIGQAAGTTTTVQALDLIEPLQSDRESANYLLGIQAFGDPIGNVAIPKKNFSGNNATSERNDVTGRASAITPQLETSTEDNRASIGWNRTVSYGGGGILSHALSFSAPVAKSGDTELSRFGSFTSDAKLSYAFSRFSPLWKLKGGSNHLASRERDQLSNVKAAIGSECPATNTSTECQEKRALSSALSASDMLVSSNCAHRPKGSSFEAAPSTFWGGSFSVGYQSFEFKDPETFTSTTEDKTPWSAELYIGRYTADRFGLFRAGYTRVENYKAATSATRCREDDEQSGLTCETAAFESPKDDSQDIGFVEYRRKFKDGEKSFVKAAALKLSYDFSSNKPEIDLPIYLFNGSDGALNGGLRATWSEENDAVVGIFIGSKFSIDPS